MKGVPIILVLLFGISTVYGQSPGCTSEVSFNTIPWSGIVPLLQKAEKALISDRLFAGVRYRKFAGDHVALRADFAFEQFHRSYNPGTVWQEGFFRQFNLSWGIDYRRRFRSFEPFIFLDCTIQKTRFEGSSGGGIIYYFENAERSNIAYGIVPGTGVNFCFGRFFHIGLETSLVFLTGTTERIYWPYGYEINKTVEKRNYTGVSWKPLSGLFIGF